jgi:hypothetical protein
MAAISDLAIAQMVLDAIVSRLRSAVQELQNRKASGRLNATYSKTWLIGIGRELVSMIDSIRVWVH